MYMHHDGVIDLAAPGSVAALLAFHRARFGDARMQADDAGGDEGNDEQSHDGDDLRDNNDQRGRDADAAEDHLADAGKRALRAERRRAADAEKRARDAENELAELQRAQMSDQDRVVAERDDYRTRYEEATATAAKKDVEILRYEVAADKGLTLRQARRLKGHTREEMEADVEELLADFPAPTRNPLPDPAAGPSGDGGGGRTVAQVQAEYLAKRQAEKSGGYDTN